MRPHSVPKEQPLISAIIPCRNERHYIETCVQSILSQERPQGGMEVIIVDGLSDDGTREILENLCGQHSELRVVDNPRRVTPSAMNAGIREARGRYIAILGAHCNYASDYLRVCAGLLEEHPEAGCVGGPIISVGTSLFGRAVAAAMSHPVGIGNARHRHPDFEGYAEGACFPVFRKEVFESVGPYDETLVRNQDDELNYRFTKQGGKVFLSPRARATYFVRETVKSLFRQYFEYGYWRVAVLRKHRVPASFRQIVPPLFMSLMLGSVIIGLLLPGWWKLLTGLLPVLYGTALLIAGVTLKGNRDWRVAVLFPVAASILHVAYAWGVLSGIIKDLAGSGGSQVRGKG